MSFWEGFACGVAATYALSIGALVVFIAFLRHSQRQTCQQRRVIREDVCPEYPTVRFTHVTGIGAYVRGRDG